MSIHLNPSPLNPLLQEQLYDPIVLVQVALELQLLVELEAHSSVSIQRIMKIVMIMEATILNKLSYHAFLTAA